MDPGELHRTSDSFSNSLDDIPAAGGGVVSEKVQYFANAIYGQLEKLVKKYDEDAVKDLMPHVISLLENLDQLSNEKRQLEVDIELVKEDNSQLLVQYEREKTMRRSIEQKCLEIEDIAEDERQGLSDKITSMESIVRMLELKSKNSADHVARLEEKETEMKKDYSKLYQKYQELMRSHIDIMERRSYMANEPASDTSLPSSAGFDPSLLRRPSEEYDSKLLNRDSTDNQQLIDNSKVGYQVDIGDFSRDRDFSRGGQHVVSFGGGGDGDLMGTGDGTGGVENKTPTGHADAFSPSTSVYNNNNNNYASANDNYAFGGVRESFYGDSAQSSRTFPSSNRRHNVDTDTPVPIKGGAEDGTAVASRFEVEMQFQEEDLVPAPEHGRKIDEDQESSDDDNEAEGEAEDVLGSTPLGLSLGGTSDTNAAGRLSAFSVGREFDKLLRENAELLETKNALNVVKDDLIFQVDGLNNELRIFRERITSLEEIREHLQLRVNQLEEESKRNREELDEAKQQLSSQAANNSGGEEDGAGADAISMGVNSDVATTQKRRFTRMEMARVLMERNVYKERLIELQETVRWVESLRANRENPENSQPDQRKKSSSIWNIFGGLFASSSKQKTLPLAPTPQLPPPPPMPAGLLDANLSSGRLPGGDLTATERQPHKRSFTSQASNAFQGRVEAYGWSIPATNCMPPAGAGMARSRAASRLAGAAAGSVSAAPAAPKPEVPVPIPVCCQPLPGSLNGMKIWSAAVAFSSVGFSPDGSRLFERSVFYGSPRHSTSGKPTSSDGGEDNGEAVQGGVLPVSADVAQLEEEVSLEQHRVRASRGQLAELSSVAWLTCSSNNVNTHVFLVDLRQPSVLLAGFTLDAPYVSQVCAVPGAKPTDIAWQPASIVDTDGRRMSSSGARSEASEDDCVERSRDSEKNKNNAASKSGWSLSVTDEHKLQIITSRMSEPYVMPQKQQQTKAEAADSTSFSPSSSTATASGQINNTRSLLMPTMWFGAQDGSMFIYSAAAAVQPAVDESPQQLPAILGRVRLPSAATATGHVAGRVFVAMSDSRLAMFHRNPETREWCTDECSIIQFKREPTVVTADSESESNNNNNNNKDTTGTDNSDPLNGPKSSSPSQQPPIPAARCLVSVANRYLWVGLGREILVIEPASLRIESSFICHPRQDAQLRHACSVGDGVWLAVRIDSVLRLYHAFTHQHLQDLDLQPAIHSFMFGDATPTAGSNTALSPLRVSAMAAGGGRLWIGTHTGLVVSVPFASSEQQIVVKTGSVSSNASSTSASVTTPGKSHADKAQQGGPGSVVQVYASPRSHTLTPGTNVVPYCWVGGAQISCHGHTDSVKGIVCSPVTAASKTEPPGGENGSGGPAKPIGLPSLGVMSVGEGYRDCRSPAALQAAAAAAANLGGGGSGDGAGGSSVGLSAILPGHLSPPMTTLPSPPGEERIHMIVWQLALSGQG